MFGLKFSPAAKKAWVLLSIYLLISSIFKLIRPDGLYYVKLVLIGIAVVNPGILLYLILHMRGPNKNVRESSEGVLKLSTWGWFWRAVILYFSQLPILLFVSLIFSLNLHLSQLTSLELLLWEVPFVVISAMCCWILFSRDRRGQARLLILSVRGY